MQRSAENFSQNSSFISQTSSASILELLRDAWLLCLAHWKWFVLSVIVCLGGAYYHCYAPLKPTSLLPQFSSNPTTTAATLLTNSLHVSV